MAADDRVAARQRSAWALVSSLASSEGRAVELRNRLSAMPVEVRTRGLASTVAMMLRENKATNLSILKALCDWLAEQRALDALGIRAGDGRALLAALVRSSPAQQGVLAAAEAEAVAWLGEAKLLARAWVRE